MKCKVCGKVIKWVKVASTRGHWGKTELFPVEVNPIPLEEFKCGDWLVSEGESIQRMVFPERFNQFKDWYVPHFISCPAGYKWRCEHI